MEHVFENNLLWKRYNNLVLIMAGGLGKRMNSDLPKVLHELNGLPLIVHVVKSALQMDATSVIYIVVGKYRDQIENVINEHFIKSDYIRYINQPEPLGTGHAIQCCLPTLQQYDLNSNVLILSGDVPLFSTQSMREIMNNRYAATIVATQMEEPYGYGRIIQSHQHQQSYPHTSAYQSQQHPHTSAYQSHTSALRIVEEKDCTDEEKLVKLVNCGIYAFKNEFLCQNLPKINNNNAQQEYYLTSIFSEGEGKIVLFEIPAEKHYEVCGINTPEQLDAFQNNIIFNLL
jgi:bifunctional N-acetylglucosamine-1-phosphate-uridyltransferase/glucosamine-1-phosphate-acetyltransferase GlmU-like protein